MDRLLLRARCLPWHDAYRLLGLHFLSTQCRRLRDIHFLFRGQCGFIEKYLVVGTGSCDSKQTVQQKSCCNGKIPWFYAGRQQAEWAWVAKRTAMGRWLVNKTKWSIYNYWLGTHICTWEPKAEIFKSWLENGLYKNSLSEQEFRCF